MRDLSLIDWENPKINTATERCPRPFPGLDPLRWFISFEYARGKKMVRYEYRGKPCTIVAQHLKNMASKYAGAIRAIEFDQNGAICTGYLNTPTLHHIQVTDWNGNIHKYYYPFLHLEGQMISPWAVPMYRKQFKFDNKTWIAYDTNKVLKQAETRSLLGDYRIWYISLPWKSLT